MASAGRRSEQASVFDPQYIQLKLMQKNQRPNQVNELWYIPAFPTCKPDFGAPSCPVRALRPSLKK